MSPVRPDAVSVAQDRLAAVGRQLVPESEREEGLDLILAGNPKRVPRLAHRRTLSRRARSAGAAAAAVAVAASALAGFGVIGGGVGPAPAGGGPAPAGGGPSAGGGGRTAPAPVVAVLYRLADVAKQQPSVTIPAGEYSYQEVHQDGLAPGPANLPDQFNLHNVKFWTWDPSTYESWTSSTGEAQIHLTYGAPVLASAKYRAAWEAAGRPALNTANPPLDSPLGASGFKPSEMNSLPTNPAALLKLLQTRKIEGGPPGNFETFSIIYDLLNLTYVGPAIRAALFQVAASLPGVRLLGTKADHEGQSGTAIGYVDNGSLDEIIFDPSTSVLLAENIFVGKGAMEQTGLSMGTETFWSVYLPAVLTTSLSSPRGSEASGLKPASAGSPTERK
ncbi:MAG: CU044_5270 family protein [Acidimicrobiales bacterium]